MLNLSNSFDLLQQLDSENVQLTDPNNPQVLHNESALLELPVTKPIINKITLVVETEYPQDSNAMERAAAGSMSIVESIVPNATG